MIRHHPDDAMLQAHAAGTLDIGFSIVLDAHLEHCGHCRARLQAMEAIGGLLLEAAEPAAMSVGALDRTMARLDAPVPPSGGGHPASRPVRGARRAAPPGAARPPLPAGMSWPRSLDSCGVGPWRWIGPSMRWARVHVPDDEAANVFLLRIGAGRSLPAHTHWQQELTQVLYGSFHDGRARFGAGDFDEGDADVHHQPVVDAGGECICLAALHGRLRFDGALARVLGSMVGM